MKKIALALVAVLVVAGGVAAMSAFEAWVINVTAHVENALYVHPEEIAFGTVFPQEYVESNFTVAMSDSFQAEDRVNDIMYKIVQKPKCICTQDGIDRGLCEEGEYAPVDYATHMCPDGFEEMLSLCPYLSKLDGDPLDNNDTGVPSYYDPGTNSCPELSPAEAEGLLTKTDDMDDLWVVDLKVPPIEGYVGQDWPAGCPVLEENDQDYGCDLWIEVTGISGLVTL